MLLFVLGSLFKTAMSNACAIVTFVHRTFETFAQKCKVTQVVDSLWVIIYCNVKASSDGQKSVKSTRGDDLIPWIFGCLLSKVEHFGWEDTRRFCWVMASVTFEINTVILDIMTLNTFEKENGWITLQRFLTIIIRIRANSQYDKRNFHILCIEE